jgi:thiol-disulfide isomerase/thioredoxin
VSRFLALALLFATAISIDAQQKLHPLDEAVYQKLISSQKGSVLLVDFWATWCSPCREEMPDLVRLEAKYRSRGFRLVTVSCDEPEQETDARQFLREHGVSETGYLKQVDDDEKFINAVDPKWSGALPALFLYDRSGRMVQSFVGETEIAELEKAIQKLL